MDPDLPHDALGSDSIQPPLASRPVRRPSKKSSSKDRQGRVYPDSWGTIRAVSPDSDMERQSVTLSEGEFLSSGSSPRATTHRARTVDSSRHRTQEGDSSVNGRVRSRTTNEDRIDLSASRRRFGSFQNATAASSAAATAATAATTASAAAAAAAAASSSQPQTPEEQLLSSSPGYYSATNSPSSFSDRPRIGRPPGKLPLNSASSTTIATPPPLPTANQPKILQLMKTTSGWMHGVVSFRPSTQTSWTPGYCSINVATGSLIFQSKDEPSHTRTLIPDLRGCRVRSRYETRTRQTHLCLSSFTAGLTVHLLPHVNETVDSWFAALLCWQPIRPKGVRNKMTKPQAVTIEERRVPDRGRRGSEMALQKDAAIIKVGKMLLWDKPTASGPRPASARRGSTTRHMQSIKSSWQRVSCTLQENGQFKLFTETDVSLVSCVQLSRLTRSAIQQLNPSVLEDEFCLAIYPQYTAHANTDSSIARPVYLALENRVLFEAWLVLLRAFTVPELYGPETSVSAENDPSSSSLSSSSPITTTDDLSQQQQQQQQQTTQTPTTSTADMFRIERMLTIKVTEAKLFRARDETSRSRKPSRSQNQGGSTKQAEGDYYTEVTLDGEVRAKTSIRHRTAKPFWLEEFTFNDLPPVLSQACVIVKNLNPGRRDWSFFTHGPYGLNPNNQDMTSQAHQQLADDDSESSGSQHDNTFGKVHLRLDSLEPGVETEKWWPVVNDKDESVGEILMRARMEETVVLMSHEYERMSEMLHSFTNGLAINLALVMPSELNQLSQTLLNIFQVSGQAVEWICSLIEDEIDGVHKESTVNRLRYTRRIHSNDARDSGQEREFLVRDLGRTATVEANLLFRGNSILTKALDLHMRRLGKEYLEETIGERLRSIEESDPECEVDPSRVQRADDLERNWRVLIALTTGVWKSIANTASRCPPELRLIFRHIRACAEDRYGDFLRSVTYSSVSGFLFLRFFCPAILNPRLFGLLKDQPRQRAQRTFTLIAKALQGLANMTTFGSKEPWMEPMNRFLLGNRMEFKQFVDSVCAIPADRPAPIVTPSYATPIQIQSRLPPTSREGFPSLPFLLDHSRDFANLIRIWLECAPNRLAEVEELDPAVQEFHELAVRLQERTKECLDRAEEAERPSAVLSDRWEDLVTSMENNLTLSSSGASASTGTPMDPMATATAGATNHRNSVGYFAARPYVSRRSTEYTADADDETPPSSSSATWDQTRITFTAPRWSETRDSAASSKNSSTYSLESPDSRATRRHSMSKENSGSKYRIFGQRRKKDRDHSQNNQDVRREPTTS